MGSANAGGRGRGPEGSRGGPGLFANKEPRVGPRYQIESLPYSHFLDRAPGGAMASVDPTLAQGRIIGGSLGFDMLSEADTLAQWGDEADRAAFEAAFFAAPCDWARITSDVNAHAAALVAARALAGFAVGTRPAVKARVRTVDEVGDLGGCVWINVSGSTC